VGLSLGKQGVGKYPSRKGCCREHQNRGQRQGSLGILPLSEEGEDWPSKG